MPPPDTDSTGTVGERRSGGSMRLERPRALDLRRLSFPPGAVASIAHRITGVALALATPAAAWALWRSVSSEAGFAEVTAWARNLPIRLALALLLAALAFHLFAGLRHLLLDAGIGASLRAARASARAALAVGAVALLAAVAWALR